MRHRLGILALLVALANLAGCATVYGSLRAPPGPCTAHCAYLTDDESRFRCLQQCPGATYAQATCEEQPQPGFVCTNDVVDHTAEGVAAAFVLLDVLSTVSDAHSHSCHHGH